MSTVHDYSEHELFANTAFFVHGEPRPQGSGTPMLSKGTGKAFVKQPKGLAGWRNAVVTRVADLIEQGTLIRMPEGPLELKVTFFFDRPKSHPKRRIEVDQGWCYDGRPGDLDKYIRAVGDGITVAGLIGDDRQIVRVLAEKRYTNEMIPTQGARIKVTRVAGGYRKV